MAEDAVTTRATNGVEVALSGVEFDFADRGADAAAFALRAPDATWPAGTSVACIGPSGCGKTTLLSLIAGIRTPRSGTVSVGGTDVGRLGDDARRTFRRRRLGLVFQEFELLEYLPVRENVLLPLLADPRSIGPDVHAELDALASRIGIGTLLDRRPARLSQGERQRVAICRALLAHPPLLLADEPTGNLDPANSRRVLELLLDEARARGATLVVVTHDHGVLDAFDVVYDLTPLDGTEGP